MGTEHGFKEGRAFLRAIEEFRKLNKDMQAGQMALFLQIALNPDLLVNEYADRVGMNTGGTITRNVEALMHMKRVKDPVTKKTELVEGAGWVEKYQDLHDQRQFRLKLTQKGKRVFSSLVDLISDIRKE